MRSGHQYQGDIALLFFQQSQRIQSAELRQGIICQNDVGRKLRKSDEKIVPCIHAPSDEINFRSAQFAFNQFGVRSHVFEQQNMERRVHTKWAARGTSSNRREAALAFLQKSGQIGGSAATNDRVLEPTVKKLRPIRA